MSATWYLVRYMPDLHRREPRNVGLVLRTPDGWMHRFVGQAADGAIDGRRIRGYQLNAEVYKTWVDYFRRKASDANWADVARMQARKRANFYAEEGGEFVATVSSWSSLLDELYAELVEPPQLSQSVHERPIDRLTAKIDHVLDMAGITPEREVSVPARYGDEEDEVPFRYLYANGRKHLMDVVTARRKPEQAAHDARELRARFEGARNAGSASSFVAFYDHTLLVDNDLDHILRPVEMYSQTVDVADEASATATMRALVTH